MSQVTLRAFRERWMWLAVGLLAGEGGATADGGLAAAKISMFDAPPFAHATYAAEAIVDEGWHSNNEPLMVFERGANRCLPLIEVLRRDTYPIAEPAEIHDAARTCELTLGLGLEHDLYADRGAADGHSAPLVVLPDGSRLTTHAEILKAALPIDTPQKAMLAVWADHRFELAWAAPGAKGPDQFHGGLEDGRARGVSGGFEVEGQRIVEKCVNEQRNDKTITSSRVTLFVAADGKVTVRKQAVVNIEHEMCVVNFGRRPAGFVDVRVAAGEGVRGELARAMHHEAESVRAFERLARELAWHAAPLELVAAARAAAVQERDHAERCARLVGGCAEIAVDDLPVRGLVELALDNAREGCVGEAYAALANAVQARAARTPELRAHFAAIAADELGHAALADAIDAWISEHLTAGERAEVRAARAEAVARLAARIATRSETDTTRALGLPAGPTAARLVDALARLTDV